MRGGDPCGGKAGPGSILDETGGSACWEAEGSPGGIEALVETRDGVQEARENIQIWGAGEECAEKHGLREQVLDI